MPALCVATTVQDLYSAVLVGSPLAGYFCECLSVEDLNELNIEIIRNTLHKAYLEDRFFAREVQFNKDSFEQQLHYGVFYSWLRLKEQEIRNVVWVAEYISQKQKDKINNYTSIY
ncbi:H(+)-transporting V0 sector ATPase subunit d [Coemansia aciculifera]|nr:H(+)-transporting V0 sector ATPase subunit d [Coemansia aciculifera]